MATTKAAGISLADLDARSTSEVPFEFEYILPNGEGSGVTFKVLGSQSPTVVAEVNKLLDARRRKEAAAEITARSSRNPAAFTPISEDIDFSQRVIAARLKGWSLDDEFTPENALKLVRSNQHIADQISEVSNDLGNFMKVSPIS
jgi:hypothetical protein